MYKFIKSLLKSLNGASEPWQIALALSLSIIGGFIPFSSIISFILIFIVFIVNVPIGLYFGGVVVFSLLGLVLDSLFGLVGNFILNIETLENVFIFMNNNIFFIWTSFNNIIVMGAFVLGLIFSIIAFFIIKKHALKITILLQNLSKKSKILKFLIPSDDKKLEKINKNRDKNGEIKKEKKIRIAGISTICGISIFFILFFLFAFDFLIKFGINSASDGRVIVNKVQSDIPNLNFKLGDIVINNENEQNIATIATISINASMHYGLRKKVYINSINMLDFNIYEAKNTNKNVKKNEISEVSSSSSDKSSGYNAKAYIKKNVNIDEILKKEKLQSKIESKKLSEMSKKMKTKWDKISKTLFAKSKTDDFTTRYNEIKKIKVNNFNDVKHLVQKSTPLIKDLNTYSKEINTKKQEFNKDKDTYSKQLNLVKSLFKSEYENLLKKYGSGNGAGLNLVKTYISPVVGKYIEQGMGYYTEYGYLFESDEANVSEKHRNKGKWIKFKSYDKINSFYITKVNSNGDIYGSKYVFKAQDITDNHNQLGKATKAKMLAKSVNMKELNANIFYDSRIKRTPIVLNVAIDKLKSKKINSGISLKDNIINTISKSTIYDYKIIKSNTKIKFLKTKMSIGEGKTTTNKVLANINNFNLVIGINGDISGYDINIVSNLDKKLSSGLSKYVSGESKKFAKDLKTAMLKKQTKNLNGISDLSKYGDKFNKNSANINNIQNNISSNQKQAETKAKNKVTNNIKKQAEDKLKGLLKF
jgi:uncharacterized protein (TIGR03545 family)/uncharacterized protein (TIGR03546 family)